VNEKETKVTKKSHRTAKQPDSSTLRQPQKDEADPRPSPVPVNPPPDQQLQVLNPGDSQA